MVVAGKGKVSRTELAQRLVDSITVASRHLRSVELPSGMTRERLIALGTISEYGTVSVSDLAAALQVKVPTISRMISSLVEDGLVIRRKSKEDGRGILVSLSAKGQRAYQEANRQSLRSLKKALGDLSERQVSALSVLAMKLESLQRDTNSVD